MSPGSHTCLLRSQVIVAAAERQIGDTMRTMHPTPLFVHVPGSYKFCSFVSFLVGEIKYLIWFRCGCARRKIVRVSIPNASDAQAGRIKGDQGAGTVGVLEGKYPVQRHDFQECSLYA